MGVSSTFTPALQASLHRRLSCASATCRTPFALSVSFSPAASSSRSCVLQVRPSAQPASRYTTAATATNAHRTRSFASIAPAPPGDVPIERPIPDALVKANRLAKLTAGPGGRSSVSGSVVTVFGCTGFLGRYLVNQLGKEGNQVITAYRGEEDSKRHMKIMGDLGQIVPLRFHLNDDTTIRECVRNSDIVYNLVGRDFSTKNFSLEKVHVEGAERIARICAEEKVPTFIHVSALGANKDAPSVWLQSKGKGEEAVMAANPNATIVRPGWMYGHEDRFLNMIGSLTSEWPRNFLLGRHPVSDAVVRPIYVGDVARALHQLGKYSGLEKQVVELYGPEAWSWDELSQLFCQVTFRKYSPIHLHRKWMMRAISLWQYYPHAAITPSLIERTYVSDRITKDAITVEDLGLEARLIEDMAIHFLRFFRSASTVNLPFHKEELKLFQRTHPELYQ